MRHTAALFIALLASPSLAQLPPEEPLRVVTGTQEEDLALRLCAHPAAKARPDGAGTTLGAYCGVFQVLQVQFIRGSGNGSQYDQAIITVLREGRRLGLI